MRPRPRPLARWTTRRLDPRPPASVSRVTGVNREACRSSFGCVARRWLAGAGERAVPTTSAGHVRGRASRGTSTDVTGAMPSRAARSPASRAARPRRRATRGFFFARDAAGFFNSRRAGCAPRRATRAARASAAGSPPPDTWPRSRASRDRDRAVVGSSADGRSADGESERSRTRRRTRWSIGTLSLFCALPRERAADLHLSLALHLSQPLHHVSHRRR